MSDLGISGTKQTASRGPDLVWHFSMSFVSETFESSFHGPPVHPHSIAKHIIFAFCPPSFLAFADGEKGLARCARRFQAGHDGADKPVRSCQSDVSEIPRPCHPTIGAGADRPSGIHTAAKRPASADPAHDYEASTRPRPRAGGHGSANASSTDALIWAVAVGRRCNHRSPWRIS